jgi:hypothetical protein
MKKTEDQNQSCPVCKKSISIFSKRIECSVCKQRVCRDHYVIRENSKLRCEKCEKNIIKNKEFYDFEYQINSLKSDLDYLKQDKNKYIKEINVKDGVISRLENQINSNQLSHSARLETLEKKIQEEIFKLKNQEILMQHLSDSNLQCQKSEKLMLEKLNLYINELQQSKLNYDEINQDQEYILKRIDALNQELRTQVPIFRIKLLSCTNCYRKIKIDFWELLRQAFIIEGRESLLASISTPSVLNQNEPSPGSFACGKCIVI